MNDPNLKPAEFTIKVSTVIWCCVIGAIFLAFIGFVALSLYQGSLMK